MANGVIDDAVSGSPQRTRCDEVAAGPALVLAHVREEADAVDVADGIQPRLFPGHALDLHGLVDLEVALLAGSGADRVEAEVAGVGRPADRHEDLVGPHGAAPVELDGDLTVGPGAGDSGGRRPEPEVHPVLAQALGHGLRGELLEPAEDPVLLLDDGHGTAECGVHQGQLAGGDPAAEDGQPLGDDRGRGGLPVGPRGAAAQPGQVRHEGRGPGADDHRVPCLVLRSADLHASLPGETAGAPEEVDAHVVEPPDGPACR